MCYSADDGIGLIVWAMEGETMKRHWLRGLLLGVCIALLLSGGVALAQGLFITADKDCVDCYPGEGFPTEERYLIELTYGGFATDRPLCIRLWIDGELAFDHGCWTPLPADPTSERGYASCEWPDYVGRTTLALGGEVKIDYARAGGLGDWVYRLYQPKDAGGEDWAEVSFLVAEDCAAAMFVPEPGSVLLLGSGLMGLAGYAALRWRTRE